ncbi:MAG: hypothetical protein ACYC27_14320 [Armatimonadota bacterium]
MNERFWNLFTDDYKTNCMLWKHNPANPVIPRSGDSWKSNWTANPRFLKYNGKTFLYYRGNGVMPNRKDENHDRIVAAEVLEIGPDILRISDYNTDSVAVDCGVPGEFDMYHVLDPGVDVFNGRVWLYYSGIGKCADSIGCAVSDDGIHFEKLGCVLIGRGPDVLSRNGRLWMVYQILDDKGRYQSYLTSTFDGIHFTPENGELLNGIQIDKEWDSFSITTMRIFDGDEYVYMVYGGSSYLADEPDYFGLARSKDMLNWEQHPGNPIFGCGAKGSADGGAIWSPALYETADGFAMLYEGSPGKYSWGLDSQICMSWINAY